MLCYERVAYITIYTCILSTSLVGLLHYFWNMTCYFLREKNKESKAFQS